MIQLHTTYAAWNEKQISLLTTCISLHDTTHIHIFGKYFLGIFYVITKFSADQQPLVNQQPIWEIPLFTEPVQCVERPKHIESIII